MNNRKMLKKVTRKHYSRSKVNRTYKDTVFRKLFNEKDKLIELYNALEDAHYGPDTEVQITTLEDMLFVDRKNDLSFTIDDKYVIMGEHQSSEAPNIPLRLVVYAGRTFENLVASESVYRTKLVKIPTPEFYLFYCGDKKWDVKTLKLSQCFKEKPPENSMELVVKVVDLSYNEDNEILKRSETLKGYSRLIFLIRKCVKSGLPLDESIDKAVSQCIEEGHLAEFLTKYGREIGNMLNEEVTWDDVIAIRSEDAFEDGRQCGREEGRGEGREEGILTLITVLREINMAEDLVVQKVCEKYNLTEDEIHKYFAECQWQK